MNKEFCINCGHKNVFEVSKPKFCAGCGTPFNTSMASAPKQNHTQDEEEEYESKLSFDLEKLRASIVAETSTSKKTLDDLWKDPAPRDPNLSRLPSNDPSGTEILKQSMKECARVTVAKEINE